MRNRWLERVLESIADRGRELLKLKAPDDSLEHVAELCRALLAGEGEASGIALSREVLRCYQGFGPAERLAFFQLLLRDFSPDPARIRAACQSYLRTGGAEDLQRLNAVVEPPRQELLRRLNTAPNATGALVALRGDLLGLLREHPELEPVDADFRHLLGSWFNRGFLQLRRIDWHSPADVLEKLISYEAVHTVRGWEDLRRRLAGDRRCYAFFHPAMPDEPLIFVEVALVKGGLSARIAPLLDPNAPVLDPGEADTALFFSINNTQRGLRGISFGNFLIKQVLADLRDEFGQLKHFATLSPLPRFAATIEAAAAGRRADLDGAGLERLLAEWEQPLRQAAGRSSALDALLALARDSRTDDPDLLGPPLERLALAYLALRGDRGVVDPVANFHLSNGARLERINPCADASPERLRGSFGVMVNYVYEPDELEVNHERFVNEGQIPLSRSLARVYKKIRAELPEPAGAA